MITKNETAVSMTTDLLTSMLGGAKPASTDTPPAGVPPVVSDASATPPPVAPPPPVPPPEPQVVQPKPFTPAAISARFTDAPPAVVTQPAVDAIPETPPGDTSPGSEDKAVYSWARLRTEAKTFQREAQAAKQEAEAARLEAKTARETQAQVAAELEQQKLREQELVEKLGRLSLAESPEFQQKYDLRFAEVKTKLGKALVKYAGVSEEDADANAAGLLAADPHKLPDMLSDLNPSVAGMVLTMTSEAAAIDEAKRLELANWRQTGAASSVESARRSAADAAESHRRMSDAAIEAARAFGNPVYASTDPAVKEVADEIANEFHGFVQTATEEQLIRAAAEGYAAPYLYEALNQQQAEIRELRDQLAGRTRAANPPLFPSSGYTPPPAPPSTPPNVVAATKPDSAQDYAKASAAAAISKFNGLIR